MRYKLALKTIAANDDELVAFEAGTMAELREQLFALAPDFDFQIYYHHRPVGEYFRLYYGIQREHMTFRSTYLSVSEIERAWSGIRMMVYVEDRAEQKIASQSMTSEMKARYPKIPAELIALHG
ncbi:MAG: hypothetical protein WBG46_13965 [Nonlabens sp.]